MVYEFSPFEIDIDRIGLAAVGAFVSNG